MRTLPASSDVPLTSRPGATTVEVDEGVTDMRIGAAGLAALLVLLAASARADEPPPVLELSDVELAARLGFLEERLDAARPAALAWQWGWTGFYGASLAFSVGYAVAAEDGDGRVRAIVDAAKSGVATAQTLRLVRDPLPANVGAAPMRAVPGDDHAARLERLTVGERQLLASAERAETRYSLRRHLLVVGGIHRRALDPIARGTAEAAPGQDVGHASLPRGWSGR